MLDKKGILQEIDRLKNLERHANRLADLVQHWEDQAASARLFGFYGSGQGCCQDA
jgi:hypothetical protein